MTVAETLYDKHGNVVGAILSDGSRIKPARSAASDPASGVIWDGATCVWPGGRGKGSLFDEREPACKMSNWRMI